MNQFWTDPGPQPRDLFAGPLADKAPRPEADARYDVVERDVRGFSISYRVRDNRQRLWHVKIGPEAQTEVVASRIVWGAGYHEVPSYFVERWLAVERKRGAMLGGSRFRPHDPGLKSVGPSVRGRGSRIRSSARRNTAGWSR